MLVRHRIATYDSTRYGVVNAQRGVIEYEGGEYSLNQFVMNHYADVHPARTTADAWGECWGQFGQVWRPLLRIREA